MSTFEFYRFRFQFRAIDPVHFPAGKGANAIRGAFGLVLRDMVDAPAYARLFEPGTGAAGQRPSGLADWPRPFLFRAAHLDGLTISPGTGFSFDVHVFDVRQPTLPHLRNAFDVIADKGLGARRGRAQLERVEQLDISDCPQLVEDQPLPPAVIRFDPDSEPVDRVRVRFLTPTELKSGGDIASKPEFPILFGRLRDRLSTLRSLYGAGPMEVDFQAMGARSGSVRLEHCELTWERVARRSGRTGQVHSIGGFTGEATYGGPLAEFLPWLQAARWVGV
ncbi:MAG TPA: CRISPR system precrRNA processing endoribonuclease RAMP protein Cas6, partial [Bryobacteraceae bacterium]